MLCSHMLPLIFHTSVLSSESLPTEGKNTKKICIFGCQFLIITLGQKSWFFKKDFSFKNCTIFWSHWFLVLTTRFSSYSPSSAHWTVWLSTRFPLIWNEIFQNHKSAFQIIRGILGNFMYLNLASLAPCFVDRATRYFDESLIFK